LRNVSDHPGHVDGFPVHFCAGDPGKIQQVINRQAHALRTGAYPSQVIPGVSVQMDGIILFESLTEAIDATQGSAEIVRDGIGKGFQFFVGRFEFRASLQQLLFGYSFFRGVAGNFTNPRTDPA
jgi:hypothetical protein